MLLVRLLLVRVKLLLVRLLLVVVGAILLHHRGGDLARKCVLRGIESGALFAVGRRGGEDALVHLVARARGIWV